MNRFFIDPANIVGTKASLYGEDVKHIAAVLRLKAGDQVTLCDGRGNDYTAEINSISKAEVSFNILSAYCSTAEPKCSITLFQGLPKSGKLETIIQKCVELGISDIVPVVMDRSVVRISKSDFNKKSERYQRVSMEAAKQSRRGIIPAVGQLISSKEISSEGFDALLLAYELEREKSIKAVMSSIDASAKRIGVIVGPEGGISDDEAEYFSSIGAIPFSLGRRILRTETAGPAITAIILYHMEGEA